MNMVSIRKNTPIILLSLSILLSLTPIYSTGIALAIFTAATYYPFATSGIFRAASTRIAASFLLFNAWVMVLATYGWLAHVSLLPVIYIASYILLSAFINKKIAPDSTKNKDRDPKKSLVSIVLASVGIVIVAMSFYFPHPSLASSI